MAAPCVPMMETPLIVLYATGTAPVNNLRLRPGEAYTVPTEWTAQSHIECGYAARTREDALSAAAPHPAPEQTATAAIVTSPAKTTRKRR